MTTHSAVLRRIMGAVALLALSLMLTLAGCDEAREEKVLDVEAPGLDVEVNKVEGEDGVEKIDIEAGSNGQ